MTTIHNILLAAVLLSMASCGNSETEGQPATTAEAAPAQPAAPAHTVTELSWLAGWWQNVTPGGTAFEWWTVNGDGLSGRSGFIKGKDTMVSETIVLEQKEADVFYTPTVKGQNNDQPVPFRLTSAAADSFVFENPAHDFPSKIVYRKVSETQLVATISGMMDGKMQSESFEMSKAQ